MTTETLLARGWADTEDADPSYVWVTMRRLRQKVEVDPNKPVHLLTVRGIGYRLVSAGEPRRVVTDAGRRRGDRRDGRRRPPDAAASPTIPPDGAARSGASGPRRSAPGLTLGLVAAAVLPVAGLRHRRAARHRRSAPTRPRRARAPARDRGRGRVRRAAGRRARRRPRRRRCARSRRPSTGSPPATTSARRLELPGRRRVQPPRREPQPPRPRPRSAGTASCAGSSSRSSRSSLARAARGHRRAGPPTQARGRVRDDRLRAAASSTRARSRPRRSSPASPSRSGRELIAARRGARRRRPATCRRPAAGSAPTRTCSSCSRSRSRAAIRNAQLYARVEDQNRRLVELDEAKDDFLRGVSHNLQTPLASIRGYAQQLERGAPGPPARDHHRAGRPALSRMVRQLLTVSRIESGALRPRLEVFAPAAACPADVGGAGRRGRPVPRSTTSSAGWLALGGRRPAGPGPVGDPRQRRRSTATARASTRASSIERETSRIGDHDRRPRPRRRARTIATGCSGASSAARSARRARAAASACTCPASCAGRWTATSCSSRRGTGPAPRSRSRSPRRRPRSRSGLPRRPTVPGEYHGRRTSRRPAAPMQGRPQGSCTIVAAANHITRCRRGKRRCRHCGP